MREILDSLSPYNGIQAIAFMKPTQIGGSVGAVAWMGYTIDNAPSPFLAMLPTGDLAAAFSKNKLQPAIDETPRLRGKVKEARSRDSGNTIAEKQFPGGTISLTGSNSPAAFRSRSVRNIFLDDLDGFELSVGEEGDPVKLALARTDTYGARKKIFLCSTPTVKDLSHIERAYSMSDQRRYHVPCPHCGHMQVLEWGGRDADFGIRFERDDAGIIVDVWYVCNHCHKRIDEGHKTAMLEAGQWIPEHPEREMRGYQISSLYSPVGWVSWGQIAREFLDAGKDPEKLQAWTNTRMGMPWEEAGDQPAWGALVARCEPYAIFSVPDQARIVTAGVDVMDSYLSVTVWAWGPHEESWLVWYGEIPGDPMQDHVWQQLDEVRSRIYGGRYNIASMAIDSGGHCAQAVYHYARLRFPGVMACKGASTPNRPIISKPNLVDVNWAGQNIKDGVQLWTVGTDTIKSTIYSRLRLTDPGPGCLHFPIGTPEQFFRQLTGEKHMTRNVKGFPVREWVAIRANHALDASVLAYAAAVREHVQFLEDKKPAQVQLTNRPIEQRRRNAWINRQGTGAWMG